MRKPKMVWVRGLIPGCKVPRQAPPGDGVWPKQFRYYNPDGQPFEMEVELSVWIQLRIRDGELEVFEPAAKPKPKAAVAPRDKE